MVVVHKKSKKTSKQPNGGGQKTKGHKRRQDISDDSDTFVSDNQSSSEDEESDFATSSDSDDFEEVTTATPLKKKSTNTSKKRKLNPSPTSSSSSKNKASPLVENSNVSHSHNKPAAKAVTTTASKSAPVPISSSSANGWKGPPIASEAAARKLIQQYMMAQNRPYSAIQVYDNLHHRMSKQVAQRALEVLSGSDGSSGGDKCLAFKDYGKARIFFPDQSLLQTDFTPADLSRLDAEGRRLEGVLKSLQQEEGQARAQSRALENQLPDAALAGAIAEEEARAHDLRGRVAALGGTGVEAVTPQDRAKAAAAHKKYRTAWRDRKAKVRDLLDMMADGMEKSVKFVTDLVGIETDEECAAELPPALASLKS